MKSALYPLELIGNPKERLGQASPSTPETGVIMEGFACQNRIYAIASFLLLLALPALGEEQQATKTILENHFDSPTSAKTAAGWTTDVWELKNNASVNDVGLFKLDTDNPADGASSQKVESLSPNGWPAIFTSVNIKKGSPYNLSFSFRQHGVPSNVHLLFRPNIKDEPFFLNDQSGDYKGLRLIAGEEWKRFSFDFTAQTDAPNAQLIFFNTSGKGSFWVDNLKLIELPGKVNNLLQDGSFESPYGNKTVKGWFTDVWDLKDNATADSVGLFRLDTEKPAKGNYSQQVVLLNGNGMPALFTYVGLKKGTAYKLSFAIRQQGILSGVYLLFRPSLKGSTRFLDPTGDYRGINLKPGEDWTRYSFDFTAYCDDPKAQLIFINCKSPGIFWLDDVSLAEVDASGK